MSPHAVDELNGHPHANGATQAVGRPQIEPRLFARGIKRDVGQLRRVCNHQTSANSYVYASAVEKNIPVYHCGKLQQDAVDHELLKDEWHHALLKGPGVFVMKGMYQDMTVLDAASAAFQRIITREASGQKGDHFAAGGKK